MKNKLHFITALVLCLFHKSFSQSVNYKIVENEPDRKDLFIFLNPFHINGYSADINIGYDLHARLNIGQRLQAEAAFNKAYLDMNADGVFAPANLSKALQVRGGIIFNFSSRLKDVNNKVTLMSYSTSRYSYSRYIRVRATARKTAGLRGGLQYFSNNYEVDYDVAGGPGEGALKAKNPNGDLVYVHDSVNFETVTYTGKSLGLYAGLDLKTIRDLVISTDSYGIRSNRTVNNFYLDALFTPMVVYKLRPNDHQAYMAGADVNIKDNARKLMGWRLGWHYYNNRTAGFNAKAEIGQQPGAPVGSFFLSLGMGLNLGFKVMKKAEG